MQRKLSLILLFFASIVTAGAQPPSAVQVSENKRPQNPDNNAKTFKNASVSVTHAEILCGFDDLGKAQKLLRIMFDKSLDKDLPGELAEKNKNIDNYHVIDLGNGNRFRLQKVNGSAGAQIDEKDPNQESLITFQLDPALDPNASKLGYGLISNNHVLVDSNPETVSAMLKIAISDTCQELPEKLPAPTGPSPDKPDPLIYYGKKFFNYVEAENKDKPEVIINFSLDGTKGVRRYFTIDLDISPFRIHRLGLGGTYDWERLYLKSRFSNENSVDMIEFGTRLNHTRIFSDDGRLIAKESRKDNQKLLAGIESVFNPRIETDRKFKEINSVFSWNTGLPINLILTRSKSLRIKPYIGLESGYKLKTQLENKSKWILRPFFGAELYYVPFRAGGRLPIILEANYIRRAFLNAETFYVIDENGKETIGGRSKGAKDYGTAKLTFNVSSIISPFIEYEYGRQPSKYLLVNSRYRIGFQTTFDWAWGR